MERVIFLVEGTNERLSCMLNPETVLMRRSAGVRSRESLSGMINTGSRGDNPLLFTGAGYTTIELDLVFDISIAGSSIVSEDVRDLTKPIWNLSENIQRNDRSYRPALCRFIWGKSWNISGVISEVAEKLESFSAEGVPHRSWLRLRMLRMQEQPHSELSENEFWSGMDTQSNKTFFDELGTLDTGVTGSESLADTINPTPEFLQNAQGRPDLLSDRMTGEAKNWRDVLEELNIVNPLEWLETQVQEQDDISQKQELP